MEGKPTFPSPFCRKMGNKKKQKNEGRKVSEFRVSMHCNACERTVAKTISKFKGVEFVTDKAMHKVVVKGQFDPQKVMKKLRKKTGKRVEIVINERTAGKDSDGRVESARTGENSAPAGEKLLSRGFRQPVFDCCGETEWQVMFSDENPNACSIV